MSKILVDTIDTRSGTSTLTVGSSNSSAISLAKNVSLGSSVVQSNFLQPAFYAYGSGSNQTVNDATATKVTVFNTEGFDSDSMFADNRFTPTVAGKYFVYTNLYWDTTTSNDYHNGAAQIRKNGTNICAPTNNWNASGGNAMGMHVGVVVDMNGSSDYVEIYCYQNTNSGNAVTVYASQSLASFGAYRVGT